MIDFRFKLKESINLKQFIQDFDIAINDGDLKDLYDGIHTTPSGSKKVGYLISEYIISN